MDSDIALALMEKARKVYGSEDTYLSFPLSPIAFDEKDLAFFTDAEDDPTGKQSLNARAQFSRLVNLVPSGLTFPPDEERYLWDVYDKVLDTSIVAMSDRSPEEEQQYSAVMDFLYDLGEDGLRVPSAEHVRYLEFNDANISLREQFNAEKIEAEMSDSAEIKTQWNNERQPSWRQRFEQLEEEWRNAGSKERVEQALLRLRSLAARSPVKTWSEWSSRFDKDLDTVTDIQSLPFVYTSYLPHNAIHANSWTEFNMSRQVAKQLIEAAPQTLKTKMQGQARTVDKLKNLSFEYSSAKVDRFWFVPDLFNSRFFKYPGIISNGSQPAEGECSAYIAGVVFARHIDVELEESSSTPGPMLGNGRLTTSVSFDFVNMEKAQIFKAQQMQISQIKPVMSHNNLIKMRPVRPAVQTGPTVKLSTAKPLKPISFHVAAERLPIANMPPASIKGTRGLKPGRLKTAVILNKPLKHTPIAMKPGTGVVGPAIGKPDVKPAPADQSIYILAFICKKVALCPNPDPDMQWNFV